MSLWERIWEKLSCNYWLKNHIEKKRIVDETQRVIELAKSHNEEAIAIDGGACGEYTGCKEKATIEIFELQLCPKHAEKLLKWWLTHSDILAQQGKCECEECVSRRNQNKIDLPCLPH